MEYTLTIRLNEEMAKALSDEAKQTGLSKGEIARDALAARLGGGARFSVMQRYIGVVRGGPQDISVNKAYRRDWNKKKS